MIESEHCNAAALDPWIVCEIALFHGWCASKCNRLWGSGLLVIGDWQPIMALIPKPILRIELVSAAKISVVVPRSLRSLCFNLTSFGYRKLRFLDRESSIPSAGDFVTSRTSALCSHLPCTLVANLRFAPFSRSPAGKVSAETYAATRMALAEPFTRVKGCESGKQPKQAESEWWFPQEFWICRSLVCAQQIRSLSQLWELISAHEVIWAEIRGLWPNPFELPKRSWIGPILMQVLHAPNGALSRRQFADWRRAHVPAFSNVKVTPKGVMSAISLFDGWPTCAGALRLRIMHLYEASFGILPHSALKRRTKSGPLCIYNGRLPNNWHKLSIFETLVYDQWFDRSPVNTRIRYICSY